MNVDETHDGNTLARRLAEGAVGFSSSAIVRALQNDGLRDVVMKELEKRILSPQGWFANAELPERVRRDKVDMALALLESAGRALKRKQLSSKVLQRLLKTFLVNTILAEDPEALAAEDRFVRRHAGRTPPAVIVVSPTKTCNLRCIGCYASSGPGGEHLEWDVFDRIITEAKTLWGLRFFTISGGEPLAYRSGGKGLLDATQKHDDCFFMMYTNGTLIDKKMAERMAEVGNLTPAISVEGFEQRTDARRGAGVFRRILTAMDNLREAGVAYGISVTATRHNAEEILSDEFIDLFFEKHQAIYGWLFQYMPIGRSYTQDLLVTPEQRLWMWRRTWQIIRERKILLADFWNCGTVSEGCIAAGRHNGGGYLYIDWNGKVTPCTFVPYSPVNVHDVYERGGTLDDVYDLPYFEAIRRWQEEYALGRRRSGRRGNLLLPCSLRDHYATGRGLIDQYRPEPEDQAAAEALSDPGYYEGMVAYDEHLRRTFEPVWEQEYVEQETRLKHQNGVEQAVAMPGA